MKLLNRCLWALIYALPAVLFFSYYPIISLGANSSMNFELSLPLIWLVLFDGATLAWLIATYVQQRRQSSRPRSASARFWGKSLVGISDRRFFLFSLFPLYLTLSIFWSANPLRGLLTAGVMWLVFFAVFSILYVLPLLPSRRNWRQHLLLVLFVSSLAICLFCFIQSILDLVGWSRESTLLCAGCTYRSFGFPHPSGFAIEPQFMGNLLLAPTLTALYLLVFRTQLASSTSPSTPRLAKSSRHVQAKHLSPSAQLSSLTKPQLIGLILTVFILSTTLFFTFSRGAIYAYAIALIIMFIFALRRHQFRWSLIIIPVMSFLVSLGLQGTFAALSPTSETFVSGITKSIHQLSLGRIDLRPATTSSTSDNSTSPCGNPVENSANSVQNSSSDCAKPVDNPANSVENSVDSSTSTAFDGYVAESTNVRLSLNRAAIDTWLSAPGHPRVNYDVWLHCLTSCCPCPATSPLTPTSVLFGVGLGGAGTAMYLNSFMTNVTSPKEIVQNQAFSLLLETGLVGIALVIFSLLIAFAPRLFSSKFLDGRSAPATRPVNTFWRHPALPLLVPLLVAYLITLNFFSGLPNALHIYLLPPLLYILFLPSTKPTVSNRSA